MNLSLVLVGSMNLNRIQLILSSVINFSILIIPVYYFGQVLANDQSEVDCTKLMKFIFNIFFPHFLFTLLKSKIFSKKTLINKNLFPQVIVALIGHTLHSLLLYTYAKSYTDVRNFIFNQVSQSVQFHHFAKTCCFTVIAFEICIFTPSCIHLFIIYLFIYLFIHSFVNSTLDISGSMNEVSNCNVLH